MKNSYIYEIKNLINGKRYIGQSYHPKHRKACHLSLLRRNKHHNIKLQNAFNKYGENNLLFNVILECNPDEINRIEKYYIWLYDTYKTGYNMDLGGYDKSNLGKEFEYNGIKYQSIHKTANELGIHPNTLSQRINKGYNGDNKVPHKGYAQAKSCEWNGVEYRSIKYAARCLGISDVTLGDRIRKGQKCAADIGIWKTGKQVNINGALYNSIKEASEKTGISRETIRRKYLNNSNTNLTKP